MKCSLGCDAIETQYNFFEKCYPIIDQIILIENIQLDKIYGTLEKQTFITKTLLQVYDARKHLIETDIRNNL